MLTIYTAPSCTSCRKALQWLDEHGIPYNERNLSQGKLSMDELRQILMMTDEGTADIISTRSNAYRNLKIDINELSLSELLRLLHMNMSLLKRPILIDHKRIQVGYNEDDIRRFVPREIRELEMIDARMRAGI